MLQIQPKIHLIPTHTLAMFPSNDGCP